jgi:predicted DNA-binding ribbon-helix-helix protein
MTRPVKRSLTLNGHATSVSLEDEFWQAFRALAARQGRPISSLAGEIDRSRNAGTGLATAIRLRVLADLQARLAGRSDALDIGSA